MTAHVCESAEEFASLCQRGDVFAIRRTWRGAWKEWREGSFISGIISSRIQKLTATVEYPDPPCHVGLIVDNGDAFPSPITVEALVDGVKYHTLQYRLEDPVKYDLFLLRLPDPFTDDQYNRVVNRAQQLVLDTPFEYDYWAIVRFRWALYKGLDKAKKFLQRNHDDFRVICTEVPAIAYEELGFCIWKDECDDTLRTPLDYLANSKFELVATYI